MPPAKVLFVHSSDPQDSLGGGETSLIALASRLDPARWQPLVAISGSGEFERVLNEAGVVARLVSMDPLYVTLADTGWGTRLRLGAKVIASVQALTRLVRREKADLVCTNVQGGHLYGALAAWRSGRPLVTYMRDIPQGNFSTRLLPWIGAHFSDRIVGTSNAVKSFFDTNPRHGDACAPKSEVVFDGIDLQEVTPMEPERSVIEEFDLADADPVITLIGRLQPLKGQMEVLEAMPAILRHFPRARLLLVGEAFAYEKEYAEALGQAAKGLEQAVVFTGQRSDIPQILSASDILVSASWHEAFGRTVVEGMAMGKPVVATRSGGPDDIVVDGDTGYLVPLKDPQALAEALIKLWREPVAARSMGEAGRQRALEHFDIRRNVARASAVFESCLQRTQS
jgi:L-malate glycosyltransferase